MWIVSYWKFCTITVSINWPQHCSCYYVCSACSPIREWKGYFLISLVKILHFWNLGLVFHLWNDLLCVEWDLKWHSQVTGFGMIHSCLWMCRCCRRIVTCSNVCFTSCTYKFGSIEAANGMSTLLAVYRWLTAQRCYVLFLMKLRFWYRVIVPAYPISRQNVKF